MAVFKNTKFGTAKFGTDVFGGNVRGFGYSLGQQGDTNINIGVIKEIPAKGKDTDNGIQVGVQKR